MLSEELIAIAGPATAAGLLVALTHAPLGMEVLRRGIIFIDLAIAQLAGLGLVATEVFFPHGPNYVAQLVALGSAIISGIFFKKIETVAPKQQEALIGVSFILAASLTILLLADHPHGGEEINHLLTGQILFVTWTDLLLHAPIYLLTLLFWFALPVIRAGTGFYLLFAVAITSSVQLVGVYVVFASLILPALSVARSKNPLLWAWLCGAISLLSGVVFSIVCDFPTGPILVVSYAIVSIFIFYTTTKGCRQPPA